MPGPIPEEVEKQIADRVANGSYRSPAEVMTAAIAALGQKEEYDRQLAALRREIDKGLADADAGRVKPMSRQALLDLVNRVLDEPDEGGGEDGG
jgi:putative addiction module CopG family antidote